MLFLRRRFCAVVSAPSFLCRCFCAAVSVSPYLRHRFFAAVSESSYMSRRIFALLLSRPGSLLHCSTSAYHRPAFSLSHLRKVSKFRTISTHLPKVRRSRTTPRAACSLVSPPTVPFPPSEGGLFPYNFYSPSEGAQKPHCPASRL